MPIDDSTRNEVIFQLVELGLQQRDAVPAAFAEADIAWSFLHRGLIAWDVVAEGLDEEHLRCLIQGLVHYSRARAGAVGGSVSPVIRLFAAYSRRFPESEPPLTQWVVANRTNPYEPFGSIVHNDAASLSDHMSRRLGHQLRAQRNEALERARQFDAAEQRIKVDAANATEQLAGAVRRGDQKAVEALLAKGGNPTDALPNQGSLVDLAVQHGRTALADFLRSRGIH